jgi:hypothetical protein
MSNKTINKFFVFVILFATLSITFSGCIPASSNSRSARPENDRFSANYAKPEAAARIESPEINESSGLAASRCQTEVLWTHNDSGDDAFIFAINYRGERLGTWKVTGATNTDWEDIAAFRDKNGECFLYIGEIGDNKRTRGEFKIYRVREPRISDGDKSSSKKNPLETEPAETIKFSYPDMRHDAETLMVHPVSGDIYVLSKRVSGASTVYKLRNDSNRSEINVLEKIADLSVPAVPDGLLTGGDISPDGKSVIVCDYFNAYEIVLPNSAKQFDEIWKEKPETVELGPREIGEAVCYSSDGRFVFATSEKVNQPLVRVARR